MSNLAAEGEQPFLTEWQVQETVRSTESEFQYWSSEQFFNVRMEEDWGEQELAEPSDVLIENDWYPDKDWAAKWNRQLSENEPCSDLHLSMVSEPELVMEGDHQDKSTPMAS